ncbi:hypothetical protein [Kitasatospora sp. NBC_01302]|uniref:hypothetical protein n=1 Tax=Kitasatospora sp. NBC_01302 TaxID=2903575 RepID=UPI002E0DAD26|nr:hypothetical protein OG294_39495 [Kitasatospora sp. NBC_01302]
MTDGSTARWGTGLGMCAVAGAVGGAVMGNASDPITGLAAAVGIGLLFNVATRLVNRRADRSADRHHR